MKRLLLLACALLSFVACSRSSASWDSVMAQDSRGRIVPLDTYCREIMRKVHHSECIEGMDPVESVLHIANGGQDVWEEPLIYQKNNVLARMLGQTEGKYISLGALFDKDGTYLLHGQAAESFSVPAKLRSKSQKDVLKLDEKANLMYDLSNGGILPLFPVRNDPQAHWLSPADVLSGTSAEDSAFVADAVSKLMDKPSAETADMIASYQHKSTSLELPDSGRIRLELICNRLKPFKTGAMGYMTCALVLALVAAAGKRRKVLSVCLLAAAAALFAFHTFGIASRWYCSGQVPMSNGYEMVVFLSWFIVLISLFVSRKSLAGSAFGLLLGGALLLVAMMSNMDPAVTPLVPVLQSPWLMFHVAVVIAGYACFGINFMLSVYCLVMIAAKGERAASVHKTASLSEMFATVGLVLMTAGTFLGAVWAAESWGSYWSWDPKETWALITILVYTICTHARLVPKLNRPKWFCILSIIGFACVLMTYFGVNYFLSGMHSYAG